MEPINDHCIEPKSSIKPRKGHRYEKHTWSQETAMEPRNSLGDDEKPPWSKETVRESGNNHVAKDKYGAKKNRQGSSVDTQTTIFF